jgi:hypothetical protein
MKLKLNRSKYSTNEAYLFHLYNDLGATDLKVACSFRNGSEVLWSKWLSYEELMHFDYNELVWKNFTKKQFLENISHRSIMDIELLLDIDETPVTHSQKKEDIKIYSINYCKRLKKHGYSFEVFFSGSKSYHISLLFPEFRKYSKYIVEDIKKRLLKTISADSMKFHTKSMIALEGVPHWKTGIVKKEVKIE